MRLLSIGYPLPNPSIDNYTAITAPSFFDYDAVFVDPASITRIVAAALAGDEAFEAADGRPIINGPTTAGAVSIADQVRRRLAETERLLGNGGVVFVMGRPNAAQHGVIGFEGCDRYSWLPAPEGVSWSAPQLRAAEGTNSRITDDHHPLAGVLREFRRYVSYRAVFDGRHPAVLRAGRTWCEARPGLPTGLEFGLLGGRVVFLPALSDESGSFRAEIAQGVVDAAQTLLATQVRPAPPYWVTGVTLPGLDEARAALSIAKDAVETARADLNQAETAHDEVAAYLDLLWADGAFFKDAVARALVLIGFEELRDPDDPLELVAGGEEVLVEVESARNDVAEWPYVRLQRRLEERLLRTGKQAKGLVVVNGFREKPLESREHQFTDSLRIACENYRYALITSETLLQLAERALQGADAADLASCRLRIIRAIGHLTREAALGEAPAAETGTVF